MSSLVLEVPERDLDKCYVPPSVSSAPDCVVSEIDNKRALERRLRDVKDWDNGWAVITRVVRVKLRDNSGIWRERRVRRASGEC